MKTDNLMAANYWYGRALEEAPDNADVMFDLGVMHRKKQDYETAFELLSKAYEKAPKHFGPFGLELLPDTLLKAGRYDEASAWCDKIQEANPRSRMLREVMENKRKEISSEKIRVGQKS